MYVCYKKFYYQNEGWSCWVFIISRIFNEKTAHQTECHKLN